MKNIRKNRGIKIFAAVAAVLLLSSCNRGTGCPSAFELKHILSLLPF